MSNLIELSQKLTERLVARQELDAEIAQLQAEIGGGSVQVATSGNGRGRGRKAGKKTATAKTPTEADGRRGRAPKGDKTATEAIEAALKKNKKGLDLKTLTKQAIKEGYKTESKNPGNVIYQAVHKLMTEGQIEKTKDHTYQWKKAA